MDKIPVPDLSKVDANGGFLCFSTHWRPNPKDRDPDRPGEKLSMTSYLPVEPDAACLCGSGKAYGSCCRPKRYWHAVCPDPGMEGYSLLSPQAATFHHVDGAALREQLMEDTRLCCVDDRIKSSFWILWGDPALEDQYGILCFGDIELKKNRTLLVTAMSDLRMQILLNVVKEASEDRLGVPQITHDEVPLIDKPAYGPKLRRKERKPRSKWRKRLRNPNRS